MSQTSNSAACRAGRNCLCRGGRDRPCGWWLAVGEGTQVGSLPLPLARDLLLYCGLAIVVGEACRLSPVSS